MVVVQAVLLFWSDIWVLIPRLEKSFVGFHHWAVRRMASMGPKNQCDETWVYTPIGAELKIIGLEEIGTIRTT